MLLKYKPLVAFLRQSHLQTYIELTKIYSTQMESIYDERLKQYFKDTAKLIAKTPKSSEFLSDNVDHSFQFSETLNTSMREQEEQQ